MSVRGVRRAFALFGIVILLCSGCAVGLGVNTSLVGPETASRQVYAELRGSGYHHLKGDLYFERGQDIFIIGSSEATRVGVGIDSGLRYYISDRLSVFGGGGLAIIPDGGDLDKLAHSWVYGTLNVGISYHQWSLLLRHLSAPFHGADEGDSGINVLLFRMDF